MRRLGLKKARVRDLLISGYQLAIIYDCNSRENML